MPVLSPDASKVALARKTGQTGPVNTPSLQALSLDVYEIVVVDVATGAEQVVARDALGLEIAPLMAWNAEGTHLLITWPANYGP